MGPVAGSRFCPTRVNTQAFEDPEVVDNYQFRPDYPSELYPMLAQLAPSHRHLLDLGCGTGKIARGLSGEFARVSALDASSAMLRVGQALDKGNSSNIEWINGPAESTEIRGEPVDLLVAAESIHWMDHAILFPRLLAQLSSQHCFVVIEGDDAHEPPWRTEWHDFLREWILRLTGEPYLPGDSASPFAARMSRHKRWIEIEGHAVVEGGVDQLVEEFILCQHSRATFAPSRLGANLPRFDAQLREILQPYATNNRLSYQIQTNVEWGQIKPAP